MSLEIQPSFPINNTLVGFVQQPDGRGTLTILFSCLLTLSLCVWSAVHLDLPEQGESKTHYTFKYVKWSILGIFGPELLIWVAWRQFISARTLTKSIQEDARAEKSVAAAQQWSVVHSFYVGHSFIPDHQRLHVTPRGIRLLAKCGLLPHITIQEIDDKSKTDETAKLLCCVQVTWILVQTITRLAIGLAISPLEINTLGHVICALMMYALWWHKPRWVKEPITLRGDWTPGMCAFMYVSSQVSAEHRRERSLLRNFGVKTELSGMSYTSQGSEMLHAHEPLSIGVDDTMAEAEPGAQASHPSHAETSSQVSANNDRPSGGRMTVRNSLGGDKSVSTTRDPEHIALEAMRQVRWKLVCDAIEQYPAIRQRLKYPEHNSEQLRYREALQLYPEMPLSVKRHFTGYREEEGFAVEPKSEDWTCFSEELVVDRPRNWPGDELVRHMQGHLMGMILWFSSTIYGAVHLAGWNQIFPTAVEQWFWRASAAYIVFSGLLWSFLNLLGHVSGHVWLYWYDFLAENVQRRSHILIYILSAIGGTAYVIARTYLVVEAFVSLRALPASAFESPSWILTVPHIS